MPSSPIKCTEPVSATQRYVLSPDISNNFELVSQGPVLSPDMQFLLSADDTLLSQTICDTLSNKIQRHICVITENGEKTYVPISDAVPDKENCYLIENSFVSHCEGDNQINLTEQDMETNCAIELLEENAVLQVLTTNKDPFMPSVSQKENNDEEECMMDANKENESKTPTRKRKIETKEWKRNQRKQAEHMENLTYQVEKRKSIEKD